MKLTENIGTSFHKANRGEPHIEFAVANGVSLARSMSKYLVFFSLVVAGGGLAWQQSGPKLPPPSLAPVAPNRPKIVDKPNSQAQIRLPKGFAIEEYASGFARPWFITLGPNPVVL